MKKTFCDRCGKELVDFDSFSHIGKVLNSIRYTLTSITGISDAKKYDLCDECQSDLYDWLNSSREEEKK